MSNQIINGYELMERVVRYNPLEGIKIFRDANYFLPSRDWLQNAFAPFLRQKFWAYKRSYVKSRFDCDKFAYEARLDAKIDAFLMANAAEFALEAAALCLKENAAIGDAGMAFLYVESQILPGRSLNSVADGMHAHNMVFHPDGESAFEPQNSFITDARVAFDPVPDYENPDRPSNRVARASWFWV